MYIPQFSSPVRIVSLLASGHTACAASRLARKFCQEQSTALTFRTLASLREADECVCPYAALRAGALRTAGQWRALRSVGSAENEFSRRGTAFEVCLD